MAIVKEERIGNKRLILGDCLAVMPTLGRFDAVDIDNRHAVVFNQAHEKSAKRQHRSPARSDKDLGTAPGGDRGPVCERGQVAGRDGEALRDFVGRFSEGAEAPWTSGEVAGEGRGAERQVQGRHEKHGILTDEREGPLQSVRGDTLAGDPSSGRGAYEQRAGQSGSSLLALPLAAPQAGVVGFPEGWAILTDPPYGIGAAAQAFMGVKKRGNSKCAPKDYGDKGWDDTPANMGWFNGRTPAIIWGGNFLSLPSTKRWLVWDKMNDGMALADCEIAWTNTDGAIRLFRHEWSGFRRGAEQGISRHHPTQKPLALMEWCLGFLPDAKTILDPFMGSGTTLVACQRMGRHGTGVELDEEYWRIACERVHKAWQQPDLLIPETRQSPVQEGFDL